MIYNVTVSPYQKNVVDTQYHFKQQDYGAVLKIFVEDFDTANTTCRIIFRRADGVIRQYTIDSKQSDGSYEYALSADDTYAVGKCVVDLKFYDENKRESTASFIYYVDRDSVGQHFESGDYFDAIGDAIGKVEKAVDNCNKVTEEVEAKLELGEYDPDKWYTGSGVPSNDLGKDGDLYLDITTSNIYEKVQTVWELKCNIQGIDGVQGSEWHTGTGEPSTSLGKDGDYYLNCDQKANDVYTKINGLWQYKTNIKGESGVYISDTEYVTPPDWANIWIVVNNDGTSTVDELIDKKVDKSSVVNNLTTNQEGYVLDARVGKTLKDNIDTVNNNLQTVTTSNATKITAKDGYIKQVETSLDISGWHIIFTGSDGEKYSVSATQVT